VIRSLEVLRDLEEIHFVISLDNPEVADRFLEAITYSPRALCHHPNLGPRYQSDNPELLGLRFWPVRNFRNYLIFYRPEPEADILRGVRILHGARDISSELQ